MLATREAWGYAQIGDAHRFRAAVDSALDTHGDATEDEPASLRSFDAAELHGTVGARFRDMARHDRRHPTAAVVSNMADVRANILQLTSTARTT